MSGNRVENVTIVGGGTAGWLAACMLDTFLNERRDGPPVSITLIESPRVPTIGVGEATVPGMRRLLQRIGIDESMFMLRCNASFKYGVRFVGWNLDRQGRPITFLHPGDAPGVLRGKDPAYHFHRFGRTEGRRDLVDALVPNTALTFASRGPRGADDPDFEGLIRYAYQIDASLFAQYLKEVAIARGVRHVLDDVQQVRLDERGFVATLQLERAGSYPVEFVVDCSGFRGLIIGDALKEPFLPLRRHVLCDRAMVIQLPHPRPNGVEPCVTATALGAGWAWNLPLYTRVGTGYVYSSAFRSDEEAREEFLRYLEQRGFGRLDVDLRVIPMQIGRRRRSWVKNCVAIGLSSGFVEPLEATAIHTIAVACRHLATNFPDKAMSPALAARFDKWLDELTGNILDFIVLHYWSSNRDEPFWRASRNDIEIPASLAENLELWRHVLPSPADITGVNLFAPWSFLAVLYSKGWYDDVSFPIEGSLAREDWQGYVARMDALKHQLLTQLPDHYTLLTAIRARAARRMFGGAPLAAPRAAVP